MDGSHTNSALRSSRLGRLESRNAVRRRCNADLPTRETEDQRCFPGFTIGGPILKDKIFFFLGFNPEFNDYEEKLYEGPGLQVPFSQNTQTYYTNARLDFAVTQKVRVYASWLYQYQREAGESLPTDDSTQGYYNVATGCFGAQSSSDPTSPYYCTPFSGVPISAYSHSLGYSAPNQTINTGADWTITNHLVSTTRFGYYFENYHDFGYPTGGNLYIWQSCGLPTCGNTATLNTPTGGIGAALPTAYQQSNGYNNVAFDSNDTAYNANKDVQFDQDFAWYHSGWGGTHNFNFGYQLNRLSNALFQRYNEPYTQLFVGNALFTGGNSMTGTPNGVYYSPGTPSGIANCEASSYVGYSYDPTTGASTGACTGSTATPRCLTLEPMVPPPATITASSCRMHSRRATELLLMPVFASSMNICPAKETTAAHWPPTRSRSISDGAAKSAPRIGAAWDVFKDGRMKVFGSYGKFYDVMKLNVAISSFGGQYWQNCTYLVNTPDLASIAPAFAADGRYCEGPDSTSQANFAGGGTPAGLVFIENQNNRAFPTTCSTCSSSQEGVAPGLKPYSQHETVFGFDYQLNKGLAFEARWDRRRLDNAIEDSAIFNPNVGETFVIVNPAKVSTPPSAASGLSFTEVPRAALTRAVHNLRVE